jgi:hypothetical protein
MLRQYIEIYILVASLRMRLLADLNTIYLASQAAGSLASAGDIELLSVARQNRPKSHLRTSMRRLSNG